MLLTVKRILRLMDKRSRITYLFLVTAKSLIGVLDLVAILLVGLLSLSIFKFVSEGSDPDRIISFLGFDLPSINNENLIIASAIIFFTFFLKSILSLYFSYRIALLVTVEEARLSSEILWRVQNTDAKQELHLSNEEIHFILQTGTSSVYTSILNYLATIISELTLLFIIAFGFFIVDSILASLAILFFFLVGIVMNQVLSHITSKASTHSNSTKVKSHQILNDMQRAHREIKVQGKTNTFIKRYFDQKKSGTKSDASLIILGGMPRYIIETSLFAGIAGFALYQSTNDDLGSLASTMSIFLAGGIRITASLLPLQTAIVQVKTGSAAALKTLDFMDLTCGADPHNEVHASDSDLSIRAGECNEIEIEIESLNFRYDSSTQVLTNINLQIPAGLQLALIGPSGAGKSTLVDLILGLKEPTSGAVKLNGFDPDYFIKSNPGKVAYVPQQPGMISGSIVQNVALENDNSKIDIKKINDVIDRANLRDLIDDLPEGINTDLGIYHNGFSGGQLQRIGIARALYSEPKLIILDEATSALDAISEKAIKTTLDNLRGKVTVIIIAHRLNTVQYSDLVCLLENGRISAMGTFTELQKSNETIQNLVELLEVTIGEQ